MTKNHLFDKNGVLKDGVTRGSYWIGRRSDKLVYLIECASCKRRMAAVSTSLVGRVRKTCDRCIKSAAHALTARRCAICKEVFMNIDGRGTATKYCSGSCKRKAREDRNRRYYRHRGKERRIRTDGEEALRQRAENGVTSDSEPLNCRVCGLPVDPRKLSAYGWKETGTDLHMAAGTSPRGNPDPFGKSCADVARRAQHDRFTDNEES